MSAVRGTARALAAIFGGFMILLAVAMMLTLVGIPLGVLLFAGGSILFGWGIFGERRRAHE